MAYSVPFGTVLEGQQAEEYKKRKAEEAKAAQKAEDERNAHRYGKKQGGTTNYHDYNTDRHATISTANVDDKKGMKGSDMSRQEKKAHAERMAKNRDNAAHAATHAAAERKNNFSQGREIHGDGKDIKGGKEVKYSGTHDTAVAADAIARRNRRHFGEDCGIFESVEFLDAKDLNTDRDRDFETE